MRQLESKTIKLKKKWCGLPVDYVTTVVEAKAVDLINRGYAEEVGTKPKGRKPAATKNRAIQVSSNE